MARGNTKGSEVSVKVEHLIFSNVCVSGCLHPQSAPQQPKATFRFSGKRKEIKSGGGHDSKRGNNCFIEYF